MTKQIQVNDEAFYVADTMPEIQLCEAVKNKELNEVKKLLLFNPFFITDMVTPDIETLVGVAVRNQDLETLKILLHYGFQANMWGKDQITPLGYAAAEGYIEILQELLPIFKQYKMLINKCHILKDTPFSEAIKRGHLEAAKLLKEYGATIGTISNKSHMEYAQESNSPEMMEYCLSLDNQRLEIEKKEFKNLYLATAKQGDLPYCWRLKEKNDASKISPDLEKTQNKDSQTPSDLYKSFLLEQQKYLKEQENVVSNLCQNQREKATKLLSDVLSIPEVRELSEIVALCEKEAKHTMWNKVTSFFPFGIRTMKAWTNELVGLNQEVKNSLAYEASHAGDIGTLNAIEQILFPESIIQNDEVNLIELPS